MTENKTKPIRNRAVRQYFTVDQANARLPLVKAITADMVHLSKDVLERRQRLESLLEGRKPGVKDAYSEELAEMYKSLDDDTRRLNEYLAELTALGVEPKGAVEGLVDFPALMDGREVYLCWRLGESEITHWHELDGGFAGRQPLAALFTTPNSGEIHP